MRATSLSWAMGQNDCRRNIAVALWSACLVLLPFADARGESCIDYQDYMHEVGHVNLSVGATEVAVAGNHAYVVGGNSLKVVDITLPPSPAFVTQITVSELGGASDVEIVGTRAYIAAGPWGLRVVDVSNSAMPVTVGAADTPGYASDVAVAGNYCFIADGEDLKVIQVAQDPWIVGSIDPPNQVNGVAASGSYAYVACASAGLHVIDASNPTMPMIVGSAPTGNASGVAIAGSFAYVATDNGLVVVDVSVPTSPLVVATAQTGGASGVSLSENIAIIDSQGSATWTVDISDPFQPAILGAFLTTGDARGVAMAAGHAYVAVSANGLDPSALRVFDLSNPRSPEQVSEASSGNSNAKGVALAGNYALLAKSNDGLLGYDVSDPSTPSLSWVLDTPGMTVDVVVSGNYAYVADMTEGLHVADISIPTPAFVGSIRPGNVIGVAVSGHYAYAAAGSVGLFVIDISNPALPFVAGVANTPGSANKVAVAGNYAYVADNLAGLTIVNVSNPAAPVIITSLDTGEVIDVVVEGTYAYAAARGSGLQAIDVSNPFLPALVGTVNTPIDATSVAIAGDYAYVGDALNYQVVDISDPFSMFVLGAAYTNAYDAAVADEYVYVAAHFDGLKIFTAQCSATLAIGDPMATVPVSVHLDQNHPNPFARTTSIAFALPAGVRRGSLAVFDALGRQVRVLSRGAMSAGNHEVVWDRRDSRGAFVPSGVYFYRLTAGDYREEKKMVVLRAP